MLAWEDGCSDKATKVKLFCPHISLICLAIASSWTIQTRFQYGRSVKCLWAIKRKSKPMRSERLLKAAIIAPSLALRPYSSRLRLNSKISFPLRFKSPASSDSLPMSAYFSIRISLSSAAGPNHTITETAFSFSHIRFSLEELVHSFPWYLVDWYR